MVHSPGKRSVGRPREFDEDTALEAAMDEFWRRGYEATSLADLCACTGLHKGSLYQAFGDKHTLFMRALKHYADREFREVASVAFQHASPLESIRSIIRTVCDHAAQERGCMMINSVVELAPHDPEVKTAIQEEGQRRMRVLTDLLARAREQGEIRADLEPAKLAQQLMVGMAGGAAMAKGVITIGQVVDVLEGLVDGWT